MSISLELRDPRRIRVGRSDRMGLNGEVRKECGGDDRTYSTSSPDSNFMRNAWRSCGMDSSWPGYDFIGEVDRRDLDWEAIVLWWFPGDGQRERVWARVQS